LSEALWNPDHPLTRLDIAACVLLWRLLYSIFLTLAGFYHWARASYNSSIPWNLVCLPGPINGPLLCYLCDMMSIIFTSLLMSNIGASHITRHSPRSLIIHRCNRAPLLGPVECVSLSSACMNGGKILQTSTRSHEAQ